MDRINKLRILIEELRSESFSDQYGLADWVETNEIYKDTMEILSKESDFYLKLLKEIKEFEGL